MTLVLPELPCVIYGIDEAEYHSHQSSLSHSGAKKLLDTCPKKFKYEQDHPGERKQSAALALGSLAHAWLLEGPDKVKERYVCLPEDHKGTTKDGKQLIADIEAAGKRPVPYDDYKTARGMFDAMRAEPIYALFEAGHPEVAMFWRAPDFDVTCRAKLDWLPDASGLNGIWKRVIPDYKTAISAHPDELKKALWNFSYYMQDYWYTEGVEICGLREDPIFRFVCQEKDAPYIVTVYEPDEETVEIGRNHCAEARDLYKRCVDTGIWPPYAVNVVKLGLPRWALRS